MEEEYKKKLDEFQALAEPLIRYLNENYNPHTTIIISYDSAELLSGEMAFPCTKYIPD